MVLTLPEELVKELGREGFVLSTPCEPKYEDMPRFVFASRVDTSLYHTHL
jgi:hypothetical protein